MAEIKKVILYGHGKRICPGPTAVSPQRHCEIDVPYAPMLKA